MSKPNPGASQDGPGGSAKTCRAILDGSGCVRERGHPYSDWASNPKKLHRTKEDVLFTGGIKSQPRVYKVPGTAEHFSEADYQTWMDLP